MNTDIVAYYKERAAEYERIYLKPERQEDLQEATAILQELFKDRSVVEIACGTGYWTEKIAKTASSIFATDINDTVLEIAKQKNYPDEKVSFAVADIFKFHTATKYQSLFGGFIWSHIPLQELDNFLQTVSKFILPGGNIVFMDNKFVEGSNLPITNKDEQGNTFQTRALQDGSTHLVLKNFPTRDFLHHKLSNIAKEVKVYDMKYYWILNCRTMG